MESTLTIEQQVEDLKYKLREAGETISNLQSIITDPGDEDCDRSEECFHCWKEAVMEKATELERKYRYPWGFEVTPTAKEAK